MTVQNLELRNNTSMNNDPLIMAYRYDQLNRIKKSEFFTWDGVPSTEEYDPTSNQYSTDYSYDPNGNLVNLNRFSDFEQIDAFQYQYTTAGTNQLSNLSDAISGTLGNDFEGNSTYTYDPIGNLISDSGDGISEIKWTVAGKVKEVVHTANGTEDVEFKYDALGNRVVKIAKGRTSGTTPQSDWIYTYYVRDAQGNILATYTRNFRLITSGSTDVYRDQFYVKDYSIFGSSRVGVKTDTKMLEYSNNEVSGFLQNGEFNYLTRGFPVYLPFDEEYKRSLGDKQFELANHLGNVLATISDRKVGSTDVSFSPAIKFDPAIISAQDYYPFGMIMPKRSVITDKYRFGFNGQEKDDEITGVTGSHYTALFWEYDSRIGRRWNLDPKPNPSISQYNCFAGNPIWYSDVLGDTVKGDLTSYNKVKSYVSGQISSYSTQIGNVNTKISERTAAGKSTARLERKRGRLESAKATYQGVLDEYSALESSTQVYNIATGVSSGLPSGSGGVTEFNSATGYVDVKAGTALDLLEALPHELKHAYQFETGKISLGYSGGGGSLYDLQDEIEAYSRGKLFGYYSGQTINASFVRARGYGSLGSTQNTLSTPSASFPGAPTMGDQIKGNIYRSGKSGTSRFEVVKDWQIWYNQGSSGSPFTK